jgi:hypothetical protein
MEHRQKQDFGGALFDTRMGLCMGYIRLRSLGRWQSSSILQAIPGPLLQHSSSDRSQQVGLYDRKLLSRIGFLGASVPTLSGAASIGRTPTTLRGIPTRRRGAREMSWLPRKVRPARAFCVPVLIHLGGAFFVAIWPLDCLWSRKGNESCLESRVIGRMMK